MYSIFTPHTDVQCAALLEGAVLTSATERLELLATKLGCCAELLLAVSLEEALETLQATAHDRTHHIAVVRCEVLLPPKELPLPDAPLPTSLLTPVAAAVRRRPNTIGLLSDDGGDDLGMAPLEAVFDVDSPTSGSSPQSPVVHLPPQPTPTRISRSRDLVRQPHYFIISWGARVQPGTAGGDHRLAHVLGGEAAALQRPLSRDAVAAVDTPADLLRARPEHHEDARDGSARRASAALQPQRVHLGAVGSIAARGALGHQ